LTGRIFIENPRSSRYAVTSEEQKAKYTSGVILTIKIRAAGIPSQIVHSKATPARQDIAITA
jgi:hypothetical protein